MASEIRANEAYRRIEMTSRFEIAP